MKKKVLTWGGIALLVFYVVTQPDNAADLLKKGLRGAEYVATQLGEFVSGVV